MRVLSFILFLSIFTLMVPQALAFESSNDTDKWVNENEVEIRGNFSKLGIEKETQDKLLEKLRNGELIDSMKQENLDKASRQLSNISIGESKTLTFNDGSKIRYGTEIIENEKFPTLAKSPGTYQVKSYWYGGILNASYLTDFVIRCGSNNDYIISSHSVSISVIGGSFSNDTLTTPRKYETSTRRAYSHLRFNYSYPTGNATFHLYFHVGNNDYETRLSLKDIK